MGSSSAEVKITDAQLGILLAAAVDRQAGAKNISGSTSEWDDVEEAFEYWSHMMRYRLCQWRGEHSHENPRHNSNDVSKPSPINGVKSKNDPNPHFPHYRLGH